MIPAYGIANLEKNTIFSLTFDWQALPYELKYGHDRDIDSKS